MAALDASQVMLKMKSHETQVTGKCIRRKIRVRWVRNCNVTYVDKQVSVIVKMGESETCVPLSLKSQLSQGQVEEGHGTQQSVWD